MQRGEIIALCLDRSEFTLVAILAVLKAGAAYVPLEPRYPDERIAYILGDTQSKLVLTDKVHAERLVDELKAKQVLAIDDAVVLGALKDSLTTNPDVIILPQDLAYIIYTSGTTGNPKGVLQPHKNIVRLFSATQAWYQFVDQDAWVLFHSYVFDFSVWEIWGALLYGAKLVIPSYDQTRDMSLFYELCQAEAVTVLNQTPSAFYQFMEIAGEKEASEKLTNLRYVIFGGEVLNLTQLKPWFDNYGYDSPKLINMYGITETTVHVTYKPIEASDLGGGSYIGQLIPDLTAYVLDNAKNLVPMGAVGELYVGGEGLADGYLNRPDLTAQRFIKNPFQTQAQSKLGQNSRIYKTGDLVRLLKDGSLEYIGRNDSQVKIKGYRIELGEIESILSRYPGVKQSVVIAKIHQSNQGQSTGNKYLAAYYVSEVKLEEVAFMSYLNKQLPEYMVPNVLMHLTELPLTINGKVDTKQLPEPEFQKSEEYVAPRNEIENQVCGIWAELLGIEVSEFSIRDDFFRLGGDSIISIQLVGRMRQRLGLSISVKDIFNCKTVERLYDSVLSAIASENRVELKTEQGRLSGMVPLLPIQEWFFSGTHANQNHWNQAFSIKAPILDLERLRVSIEQLVDYHDAFRLKYKKTEDGRVKQYYDDAPIVIEVKKLDVSALSQNEVEAELTQWQSNFDIEYGPMFCVGYLSGYKDGNAQVFFALHHLIVDAVSWRILADDLKRLYAGESLGEKGSSYRQWSEVMQEYAQNNQEEKIYWGAVMADYDEAAIIASPKSQVCFDLEFSQEFTRQLLQKSNRVYNTQINDVLLTALALAMSDFTLSTVNHITLEGHGREELGVDTDVTGTLGWFTSMYPARLEIGNGDLGNSLKLIKEYLRDIPNKGVGYGALANSSSQRLPRISFNYLGQLASDSGEYWSIASEGVGQAISSKNDNINIVDINGMVINGSLTFNFFSKLSEEGTQRLARLFQVKLEELVQFILKQSRTYLTPSDVGGIVKQNYLDEIQSKKEVDDICLANNLQQGFVYHALNQGDVDDAYCVQIIWRYESSLDVAKLRLAWENAQKTYPSLRLRFAWDDILLQILDRAVELDWSYVDLSNIDDVALRQSIIDMIMNEDRLAGFDLAQGGLMRIHLIKQSETLYTCIFNHHHAILDGWSIPVLLGHVHKVYGQLVHGMELENNSDSAYMQAQAYLQSNQSENDVFWENYVSQIESFGDLNGLLLPESRHVRLEDYKHVLDSGELALTLSGSLYKQLKNLSRNYSLTMSAILQFAWHKVLNIYGNSEQTILGTVVSGRNLAIDGLESSVGLYINTLPLIFKHHDTNIIAAVKLMQEIVSEVNARSNVSLAKLQQRGQRLFNALFVYENYPNAEGIFSDVSLNIVFQGSVEKLDYPLSFVVYDSSSAESLNIKLQYAAEIFDVDRLREMLRVFSGILAKVANRPLSLVSTLNRLDVSIFNKTIQKLNSEIRNYTSKATLIDLFEEQVKAKGDCVAIIHNGQPITYKELNTRANQLSHYIKETYNVQRGEIIALCLDRSEFTLVAILAVLKAGAAYVPLEPRYPDERIAYILGDTQSKLVLTDKVHAERLVDGLKAKQVLAIDDAVVLGALKDSLTTNPDVIILPQDLAYIIYTSGTTGNPKGVLQPHKNIVRLFSATQAWYQFVDQDAWVLFHSYVFDFSVWEIWGALLYGAKLVIPSYDQTRDMSLFYELCQAEAVTVLNQTPSAFYQFMEIAGEKEASEKLTNLRYVIFGGEVLNLTQLKPWFDNYGYDSPKLINMYGITETTVHVTYKPIEASDLGGGSYIGQLIPDLTAYVLDNAKNLVPMGAVGELYVGGEGLADGYLNRPDLTAQRFIKNPFQTQAQSKLGQNSRIYKTGDLVRLLKDGSLEYIGRNDSQVKIKGYRIELGEIESILSRYPGVKQSVVIAKIHQSNQGQSTGNKYLAAYYVSEVKLEEVAFMSYLNKQLPEYMVPNVLMHLTELPLTINGKVDTKQLPEPEFQKSEEYVAPRNEIENQVCGIWAELLGIEVSEFSIRDDFFRLGGDSIISIQLVGRMRQRLGLSISVKDIFNCKTVERLYDSVLSAIASENRVELKTEQGRLSGMVPLLPIQEWFFSGTHANQNHWNQAFSIKAPILDLERLRVSIEQLVDYHDAFRLKYKKTEDGRVKQYYDDAPIVIEVKKLDVSALSQNEVEAELTQWQSNFDIEYGPMFCVGYLSGYKDGNAQVFFALHHLIVDAVSWRILADDLKRLYAGESLGEKGSSYRQWSEVMQEYAQNNQEEKIYWGAVMADYDTSRQFIHNLLQSEDTASSYDIVLSRKHTDQLLHECNFAYSTQVNDLLLTAFSLALSQLTGCNVNHLVLEGHGREELNDCTQITNTMGWFTSMYPVRVETSGDIEKNLMYIKECLRQIPNKGIGYGALNGYAQNLLPRVSFNYLGQFDNSSTGALDWLISQDTVGQIEDAENLTHNIVDVNGLVIDGVLKFNLLTKFSESDTVRLGSLFEHSLRNVIKCTTNQLKRRLTPSDVGSIIDQYYLDKIQVDGEIDDVYFANNLQQGFIYHALSQGDVNSAYRVQLIWVYENRLAVDKLKEAWRCAQTKYPSLRLQFAWDDALVQVVKTQCELDWRYVDLSHIHDNVVLNDELDKIKDADHAEAYDLSKGGLFRVYLIKQTENYYTCIFNNHHAILDGWSIPVLLNYIHETYVKLCNGPIERPIVNGPYKDSQRYLQTHKDDVFYWESYISRIDESADLSILVNEEKRGVILAEYRQIKEQKEERIYIEGDLYCGLKALTRTAGVTVNAILQYAWHKVLSLYGHSKQTTVGTTVSGRNLPINDIESAVGLYINTLPLFLEHFEHGLVVDAVKSIQSGINEMNSRSNVNLGSLQKNGQRLFDSLFIYENYPEEKSADNGLKVSFQPTSTKLDYPLGLVCEEGENISIELRYAGELFSSLTIKSFLELMKNIVAQVVANPAINETEVVGLASSKYAAVIKEINQTDANYAKDQTLHGLFECQAKETPNKIALVFESKSLTYAEVNQSANKLANYLQQVCEVRVGALIALFLDRSEYTLIAILAVLKSGAAYVPIDPSHPDARVNYVLRDSKAVVILANSRYQQRLSAISNRQPIITLDSVQTQEFLGKESCSNPSHSAASSDLSYVIYTSGTTGRPKGVMIEHGAIVSRLEYLKKHHNITPDFVFGAKTSYVFDPSIRELFLPLIVGAKLVILSESAYKDTDRIIDICLREKINFLIFVPSHLTIFVESLQAASPALLSQLNLRLIYSCGEPLPFSLAQGLLNLLPSLRLMNQYGPSESCQFLFEQGLTKAGMRKSTIIPVGNLVDNMKAYVLDEHLNPLPQGAVGELYITGDGLSRGYLNREDLTAEKFIANPFATNSTLAAGENMRLYKTGDLVRWLPDRKLEYIGRNDFQVKIRGHRIELGGIESAISAFPSVKKAVVLTTEMLEKHGSGNQCLVGYYVAAHQLNKRELASFLSDKLPEYMVPPVFVHLQDLPLTLNGKLDHKALPAPNRLDTEGYYAPRNDLESSACAIYAKILNVPYDSVGIDDSFFQLGGNSILLIRLVNMLRREMNLQVDIKDIFKNQTVSGLLAVTSQVDLELEGCEVEF